MEISFSLVVKPSKVLHCQYTSSLIWGISSRMIFFVCVRIPVLLRSILLYENVLMVQLLQNHVSFNKRPHGLLFYSQNPDSAGYINPSRTERNPFYLKTSSYRAENIWYLGYKNQPLNAV